ncbi:hypothetical protein GCM10008931_28420 [Oceanobacillus oncorhynchi subsp. oncorhynchi]|uniref:TRAP transporter small permease n=1 Tax=Oceanobacillus oncorhynchi TaxID=545501 RepID=UPI0031E41351
MEEKKRAPIEGYICVLLFIVMTAVLFLEIIARYFFNASISWTGELSRYLFIWFIFISASYAVAERAHIRVESLHHLLPVKIRPIANIIGMIIWFGVTSLVTYLGIDYALTMMNSISAAMKLPMGLVYLGIPTGYGLMSLRLLFQIYGLIRDLKSQHT